MDGEQNPVELARRLVYFAAERTLTSWVRTALSLMALGFVIDRFGLILDMLHAGPAATTTPSFLAEKQLNHQDYLAKFLLLPH